jgi:hypothetical protein
MNSLEKMTIQGINSDIFPSLYHVAKLGNLQSLEVSIPGPPFALKRYFRLLLRQVLMDVVYGVHIGRRKVFREREVSFCLDCVGNAIFL